MRNWGRLNAILTNAQTSSSERSGPYMQYMGNQPNVVCSIGDSRMTLIDLTARSNPET